MQSSSQAVRAKEDEPFLERFIEAHEGFIPAHGVPARRSHGDKER